jgi:hypothetical protein
MRAGLMRAGLMRDAVLVHYPVEGGSVKGNECSEAARVIAGCERHYLRDVNWKKKPWLA